MVSSKGKPTDPKLREEAKEGIHRSSMLCAMYPKLTGRVRCEANAQQGRKWKRPNGGLEGNTGLPTLTVDLYVY